MIMTWSRIGAGPIVRRRGLDAAAAVTCVCPQSGERPGDRAKVARHAAARRLRHLPVPDRIDDAVEALLVDPVIVKIVDGQHGGLVARSHALLLLDREQAVLRDALGLRPEGP